MLKTTDSLNPIVKFEDINKKIVQQCIYQKTLIGFGTSSILTKSKWILGGNLQKINHISKDDNVAPKAYVSLKNLKMNWIPRDLIIPRLGDSAGNMMCVLLLSANLVLFSYFDYSVQIVHIILEEVDHDGKAASPFLPTAAYC
jgi:hypothetical protein